MFEQLLASLRTDPAMSLCCKKENTEPQEPRPGVDRDVTECLNLSAISQYPEEKELCLTQS